MIVNLSEIAARARKCFTDHFAGLGLDRPHLAAIFKRTEGLGVKRLLMSHTAWQEDMNDALCFRRQEIRSSSDPHAPRVSLKKSPKRKAQDHLDAPTVMKLRRENGLPEHRMLYHSIGVLIGSKIRF